MADQILNKMPQKPVVAGHQPNFFPWFGYFEKMLKSDIFVFSDDVQFPRDYVNRVEIPVGKSDRSFQWVLPVLRGNDQRIADKRYMKDDKELKKVLRTITVNLGGLPHSQDLNWLMQEFEQAFWKFETIADLNIFMISLIAQRLGINTSCHRGTELGLDRFRRNERLIKRLEILGADTYLSGQGARDYTDVDLFAQKGMKLIWIENEIGPRILGQNLKYSIVVGIAELGFAHIAAEVAAWKAARLHDQKPSE